MGGGITMLRVEEAIMMDQYQLTKEIIDMLLRLVFVMVIICIFS